MTLVPLSSPGRQERTLLVGGPGAPRRADRRWYEKKRYLLPLGVLLSALLGTTAGSLRDEASSQPIEAPPAAQVVLVGAAALSAR